MAAPRFKQAVEEMISLHKKEFDEFMKVHELFKTDQMKWSEKFNELGKPIMDYILVAEKRLCSKTENSGYGNYSTKLSEKFREEVKKYFPLIDFVGVTFS